MRCFRIFVNAIVFLNVSFAEEQPRPTWLTDIEQAYGNAYRLSVSNIVNRAKADKQIEKTLITQVENRALNCQARILLERIRHPQVFIDYERLIQDFRNKDNKFSPGLLSNRLAEFTKQGAESKFVNIYELDKNGQIKLSAHTNETKKASGMRATFKKVEKYTDEEVRAGTARNTAARHAVLEHVLKFLTEGSAYEQSEIVDVVYSLWGTPSFIHRKDEPLADDLIEPIYKNKSLPLVVRYTAMSCLPSNRLGDYEGFLIDAVKKSMMEEKTPRHEDVLYRVLERLKKTADKDTLSVLKGITNGPPQKVEMLRDATHKIELRVFGADQ